MRASDFSPPHRRPFPGWLKYASYAALYGIGVPLVKTLEAFGKWPSTGLAKSIRSRTAHAFGDYRPTRNDVIVCAFFKSGTTWLLQMATQIAYRAQAEFDNIHHAVPWPDVPMPPMARLMIPLTDPSPAANSPTGLRVIKTHLPRSSIPFVPETRYIACVRDPKDVCVSGYHFMNALVYGPLAPSVEHWVKFMFSEAFQYSWAEHLAGYWAARNEPNVLFLTYEGMRKDHAGAVRKIADFMDVDLSPAELQSVIHQSSFAAMRDADGRFEPGRILPWTRERVMIRAGKSGQSSELLTLEQRRFIDERCRAELVRLGSDFPYDEVFGTAAEKAI
ncbi:MAG: sulfotransferase domain-containing protein [Gammaproteobacteria bacterium]